MNIYTKEAANALIDGKKLTRETWEDQYIWLMMEAEVKAEWCREPQLKELASENGFILCAAAFRIYRNGIVETGFQLNADDFLANDWQII